MASLVRCKFYSVELRACPLRRMKRIRSMSKLRLRCIEEFEASAAGESREVLGLNLEVERSC